MNNNIKWWQAVIIIIVVFGVVALMAVSLNNLLITPYTPATADIKPVTKTRCDLTGLMASSIIADEAANGYRFNGRVSTFLCGDNGLSFSLEKSNQ